MANRQLTELLAVCYAEGKQNFASYAKLLKHC